MVDISVVSSAYLMSTLSIVSGLSCMPRLFRRDMKKTTRKRGSVSRSDLITPATEGKTIDDNSRIMECHFASSNYFIDCKQFRQSNTLITFCFVVHQRN